MPWCDTCEVYLAPSTVTASGVCPTCGKRVDPGALKQERREHGEAGESTEEEEVPPIPWHFWVLVVCVVIYLGWRLLQGIGWLVS